MSSFLANTYNLYSDQVESNPDEHFSYADDLYNDMLVLTFKDGLKEGAKVTSDMTKEERRRILGL